MDPLYYLRFAALLLSSDVPCGCKRQGLALHKALSVLHGLALCLAILAPICYSHKCSMQPDLPACYALLAK